MGGPLSGTDHVRPGAVLAVLICAAVLGVPAGVAMAHPPQALAHRGGAPAPSGSAPAPNRSAGLIVPESSVSSAASPTPTAGRAADRAATPGPSPTPTPAATAHPVLRAAPDERCPRAASAPMITAPLVGRTATERTATPTVALTFDDGPDEATAAILDTLAAQGVAATFFVVGRSAAARPDLLRRAAAEGHLIGNHTWSHTYPTQVRGGWTAAHLDRELGRTARLISEQTGHPVCWLRPPGGFTPPSLAPAGRRWRMTTALWSIDTRDWQVQSASVTGQSAWVPPLEGIGAVTPVTPPAPPQGSGDDLGDGRLGDGPHAASGQAHPGRAPLSHAEVDLIVARATTLGGQRHPIVLFHDGGGDRSATRDALPEVIAWYRAHGFTFVRLDGAVRR